MGRKATTLNAKRSDGYNEINARYVEIPQSDEEIVEYEQESKPDLADIVFNDFIEYLECNAYPLCEYLDTTVLNNYIEWVSTRL